MAEADMNKMSLGKSPESSLKHNVKDLPVLSVTVYTDRAEVKRTLKLDIEKKGDIEAIIEKLSENCDLESIRVEGRGEATITEVTSVEKLSERPEVDENAVKSIRDQITDVQLQVTVLESEKARVQQRKGIIQGLGQQVQTPSAVGSASDKKEGSAGISLLSSDGLEGVVKFLDMYSRQLETLDVELFRIDAEIRSLRDKIKVLNDQTTEQRNVGSKVERNRQVSILMDVKEPGEITLTISYLVTGASWNPRYDIRAFSEDEVVKITYFGLIKQKTGEDWNEAKLHLSTAQPSVGGTIPTLPSRTVNFKVPPQPRAYGRSMMARSVQPQAMMLCSADYSMDCDVGMAGSPPPPAMATATAEVKGGAMSTTYEVARKSTIPSDNTEHKVTVAMFDLKPEFEHLSIPKMVASTYLKAKLTNDSPYLILAGPSSVFVDNNFIAKSVLPTVSPSEKFECSLGVDFAVRIDYRPCRKINETAGGMFSKTTLTRYQQPIEVKNTHQHEIKIQVEEQLPRSEDEKIKVILISPVIPKDKHQPAADAPISQNVKGNIVWRSTIKAGATETFTLHYTVEKPVDSRDLDFKDL